MAYIKKCLKSAIPKTVFMHISNAAEKLVRHLDLPNQVLTALKPL